MNPIAKEIKIFLGTLGFNVRKTSVVIKYERKHGKIYAYITAEGPINE